MKTEEKGMTLAERVEKLEDEKMEAYKAVCTAHIAVQKAIEGMSEGGTMAVMAGVNLQIAKTRLSAIDEGKWDHTLVREVAELEQESEDTIRDGTFPWVLCALAQGDSTLSYRRKAWGKGRQLVERDGILYYAEVYEQLRPCVLEDYLADDWMIVEVGE